MPNRSSERRLAAIARRQHGLFTVSQALAAGFSHVAIGRRCATGQWCRVHTGVYCSAIGPRTTWVEDTMAAVLARRGVAARQSAAALFDLMPPPKVPCILVPWASHSKGEACSRALPSMDIATVRSIPVTSPVRTLIDLAGRLPLEATRELVDIAVTRRLVREPTLRRRAGDLRARGRGGPRQILSILDVLHPEYSHARNEWEARLLELSREAGLPTASSNHEVWIEGHRFVLDLAWPQLQVFAEFDGFEFHGRRRVFDHDKERQNLLVGAGWRPFVYTSTAINRDGVAIFDPLVRLLDR